VAAKLIHQPNQLSFDWNASSLTRPEAKPNPIELPAELPTKPECPNLETGQQNPSLVVVLPWDFRTSFPLPTEDAVLNGRLHPTDVEPENLASLHEALAGQLLVLLRQIDAVTEAQRLGIDPGTGRAPRTAKRRGELEKLFEREPLRLRQELNALFDGYLEVFGLDATDVFRKAVDAWHAGVQVVGEAPPIATALPTSIDAGVFGVEEDGTSVTPGNIEVTAITEWIAQDLLQSRNDSERQELLKTYAQDFGQPAAEELDRWSRLISVADETCAGRYDPGHPWYYLDEGDAAAPLPLEQIPASTFTAEQFGVKWPKNPAKRRALVEQMLTAQRQQLQEDEKRYLQLINEGIEALSQYDREIAYAGNDDLAWSSAMALKYNHIRNGRGRVQWLASQVAQRIAED